MNPAKRIPGWALILAFGTLAAAGAASDRARDGSPLVVVSDYSNPPFASMVDGAEPRGLEVDLMREIGRRLGRPCRWKKLAFDDLLPAVVDGRGDVAAATLGVTESRSRLVSFSRPYFETSIAIVVRAGEGEPRNLDELAGRRVGAGEGPTSEDALRRSLSRAIPVLEREDPQVSFGQMLAAGSIDAAIMDGPDAARLLAAHPGTFRRLPDLAAERYAIAVAKDRGDLLEAINRALADLEADGTLASWRRSLGQ